MSRSILVPHDGSANAQQAFEYALETFSDARIVLFHAIDPFASPSDDDAREPPLTEAWLEERRDEATALFEQAREGVDEGDATVETATGVGSPPQTIVAAVEETGTDQIVMGRRGRSGVADIRLGSAAELVTKRADVPVTVVE